MICLTVLIIGHKGYKYEFNWKYHKAVNYKNHTEYPKIDDELDDEDIQKTLLDVVDEQMRSYNTKGVK